MSFHRRKWCGDPKVGRWEVKSRLLLYANRAVEDFENSRPTSVMESISLETSHLKGKSPISTLCSSVCECACFGVFVGCIIIALLSDEKK